MATFGKTTVGGTQEYTGNWTSKWGCRFQAPASGTVTDLEWYGHTNDVGGPTIYEAVYSDNAGAPNSLLGSGSVLTTTGADAWWKVSSLTISIVNLDYYWLTVQSGGSSLLGYYDAGSTNQFIYQAEGADSPPPDASFGAGTYQARELSIRATYTPSGGGVTVKKGSCVPAMEALLTKFSALKQPREPKFQPRTFPKFKPRILV